MLDMTYSKMGERLTEGFEGCRLTAYQDSGGVWTIGYGHTAGVYAGMTCTEAQAEAWLAGDTEWAAHVVNVLVDTPLTQAEFDALTDFTFNCGAGRFRDSDVLRLLNTGQPHAAAQALEEYDHAGGKVLAGLLRRRKAEEAEFDGGEK